MTDTEAQLNIEDLLRQFSDEMRAQREAAHATLDREFDVYQARQREQILALDQSSPTTAVQ